MLYGQAYIAGIWPLVILTLAQSINTGTGAVGLLLVMNGHQNRWLLLSGISFITAFVLDIEPEHRLIEAGELLAQLSRMPVVSSCYIWWLYFR